MEIDTTDPGRMEKWMVVACMHFKTQRYTTGNGIFKYANGDEFAGEYSDDRKDGLGVYRRANGELDIKVYNDDLPSEGVRFSTDRKKAWDIKSDGSCKVTSIRNAETFRENTSIISPFLAHYLDKYS